MFEGKTFIICQQNLLCRENFCSFPTISYFNYEAAKFSVVQHSQLAKSTKITSFPTQTLIVFSIFCSIAK